MWASIAKWFVTAVLLPLIQSAMGAYLKSREKAKKLAEKVKRNQTKTEAYEKDPSDDNFSELP